MPSYQLRIQKPYLCAPACLQMILERRGKHIEQETLAQELNTHTPSKYADAFEAPISIDDRNTGTNLQQFEEYNKHGIQAQPAPTWTSKQSNKHYKQATTSSQTSTSNDSAATTGRTTYSSTNSKTDKQR